MEIRFRKIAPADVEELFVVRSSVHENPFSIAALAEVGITPTSVTESLGSRLDGYLSECSGKIVGFAMADLNEGELSVIAVLPDYEKLGIGRELLRLTEEILWSAGYPSIWLWTGTDRNTRALRLYLRAGWSETETKDHKLFMRKNRPNAAPANPDHP